MLDDCYIVKRDCSQQSYNRGKLVNSITMTLGSLAAALCDKMAGAVEQHVLSKKTLTSREILQVLVKCLVDETDTSCDLTHIAAQLLLNDTVKSVDRHFSMCNSLYDRICLLVSDNMYDSLLTDRYTRDDVDRFEEHMHVFAHEKICYAGMRTFRDKYLLKLSGDKVRGEFFDTYLETPQQCNMLVAMTFFVNERDRVKRNCLVVEMYSALASFKLSLPTPVYSGLRTTLKSFASCCVLDCRDSVDSILETAVTAAKVTTERYGVGLHIGRVHSACATSDIIHILKLVECCVKGFSQGVRSGSATVSFPFWHIDVLTLINLKNNKGTVESRVRGLDYSVGLNNLFFDRVLHDKNISMFNPSDVPGLFTKQCMSDSLLFKSTYEEYERACAHKEISAVELLREIIRERYETGRLYVYYIDNANAYTVFKQPIFSSNLCQEIFLPTHVSDKSSVAPNTDSETSSCQSTRVDQKELVECNDIIEKSLSTLNTVNEKEPADIDAVCILACINVSRVSAEELPRIAYLIVRSLDNLIDYQVYSFHQFEDMCKNYRALGVGMVDVFHLLAIKRLRYDSVEGRNYIHQLSELFEYSLLAASVTLSQERGRFKEFNRTRWSDVNYRRDDCYKKTVDKLVSTTNQCDWEKLHRLINTYGMRNACVSAMPPTATSSIISNSTPGIDPPKTAMLTKLSKTGTVKYAVPDYQALSDYYTYQFDVNTLDYIKFVAVVQKFIDQGISTNTYYMQRAPSYSDILKELVTAYNYGLKSLYYLNTLKIVNPPTDQTVEGAVHPHTDEQCEGSQLSSGCSFDSCAV